MKFDQMLKTAIRAFAAVRPEGGDNEAKLQKRDRGVMAVGLLVAALDGTILPEEYAAFAAFAKKCRGGSATNERALFDAALPAAGQLMAMAQVGVYSEKERLVAFLSAAKKMLPSGFANVSMGDIRRAFALWMAVGISDGEFSSVEKSALHVLVRRLAIMRSKKTKKGEMKSFLRMEADLQERVETIARDLANSSSRAKAEAALDELIVSAAETDTSDRSGK